MLYFTRWRALAVILIALAACLVAVSVVFPEAQVTAWPAWAQRRLMLALGPQGGSTLLLEVDSGYVKKSMLDQIRADVRQVLRDARIAYQGLAAKADSVEVKITKDSEVQTALGKLQVLSRPVGSKAAHSLEIADTGAGLIQITVSQTAMTERMRQTVEQSIQIVERRVGEFGAATPVIQRQGANRMLVELPGVQDPSPLKDLLGKTARLEFRMIDTSVTPDQARQGITPPESELLLSSASPKRPYVVKKQVLVSGGDVSDAQPGFDQRSGEAVVSFRFNTSGSRKFAMATTENVGQPFAMVLDNEVISAPIIREPIIGGSGQISGNFTPRQANDLAILLRAGALPAPLTVIDERSNI